MNLKFFYHLYDPQYPHKKLFNKRIIKEKHYNLVKLTEFLAKLQDIYVKRQY